MYRRISFDSTYEGLKRNDSRIPTTTTTTFRQYL